MASGPACELVTGWGRGSRSVAHMTRVVSQEHLQRTVEAAGTSSTPLLSRGLGRSYGDAAQCAGGTVIDCTALDRVVATDFERGTLRVEAGISLDAVLSLTVPNGWFIAVTPGTRQVTIGGAVAADVHGKNHHHDGTFSAHLERISVVSSNGRTEASSVEQPEIFWATAGGMGLTGAIATAELRLMPIETSLMLVDTDRAGDLDECMASLAASDDRYRYSVAWLDCGARGDKLGRSVLTRGDHARLSDLPARRRHRALDYRPARPRSVPGASPVNLLGAAAVRGANELWYRKAPVHRSGELQSIAKFFYPLDAISNWNLLYGPRGFTQYQFVVPFGAEATVREVIERLQAARAVPALGVLKRFGRSGPAPLSFPMPGWTLALDLPLGARAVAPVLDELDELVAAAGGRVYLAKDGRLRPELLRVMYPRLGEWLELREKADPAGIFASDLARRLSITG